MNVGFTKRQKIDESYNYLGGYVQGGYFVTNRLQAIYRYDFFNRNGVDTSGFPEYARSRIQLFLYWM